MTCPFCTADITIPPDNIVAGLTICPVCTHTIAIDGDTARKAVSTDTVTLSANDRDKLLSVRRAIRKAQ